MEDQRPLGIRPFAPVIVTAVLAIALAFSLRGPLLGLPVDAPLMNASVEAASAVVALLLAYLAFGRARLTGLVRDLALVYSLALIALINLFLTAVPAMVGTQAELASVPAAAMVVAATLFAYASTRVEREATPANQPWLDLIMVILATTIVLGAVVLVVGATEPSSRLVAFLELTAAGGFALGAIGFAVRNTEDGAPLLPWLSIAATLAAVARLEYALFPPANLTWIVPGDVLLLGFYLALAIGAAKEISIYWRDVARVAALEERRRIGRDLHDGLAQELAYIAVEADDLSSASDDERMRGLAASAQRALGESRRVIMTFAKDGQESFHAALIQTAEDVAHRFGIPLAFNLQEGVDLGGQTREDVLRIVREAVTNAGRHARADRIEIEMTNSDGFTICVRDDGRGFDTSDEEICAGGFGLRSMHERAEAMGGELRVWSAWGAGTEVKVRLP